MHKTVLPVNRMLLNYLQWVDCVSQLLRMYPFAFEFSSVSNLLDAFGVETVFSSLSF